ncbi:MAG: MATE family efflux transporter [Treponema sp.]|nr:MATE family efflux transporter [Treponema sp.]
MADFDLSALLKEKQHFSLRDQIRYVWQLSIPGILAQISSILMQYIDAAMVGKLGAESAAAIGLVASSTWLLGGLVSACAAGFTVQIAQAVGAGNYSGARNVLRQGILVSLLFSVLLSALALSVSGILPVWLGGERVIQDDASWYFRICAGAMPVWQFSMIMSGALRSSGNMKVPGVLSVLLCVLDVVGNYVFIFMLHLGVRGAALGTLAAEFTVAVLMTYFCVVRSPILHLWGRRTFSQNAGTEQPGQPQAGQFVSEQLEQLVKPQPEQLGQPDSWRLQASCLRAAGRIALPLGFQQFALCGAQIVSTRLVAPLGTAAIAANSFAITAEALCYMPGYGIGEAATTLVGQSVGAKRRDLARHFAWVTILAGMAVMGIAGVIMYGAAPFVMGLLTPDAEVCALGAEVLRIEMFAEPLFAASIVASGALRGAGDTLVPGVMNLVSMWGVRILVSLALIPHYGLKGAWIAMCVELCFRGVLFLIRVKRERWLKAAV